LAAAHPALFILFDLLVDGAGKSLLKVPLQERRRKLEAFSQANLKRKSQLRLSPATKDLRVAKGWFDKVGGNLDGIMAKRIDALYLAGQRTAVMKVKQIRTADCVVGGFRYATNSRLIGSLLLGLYDDDGLLHHVGFTSAFKSADRAKLTRKFAALKKEPGFSGNAPGGPSRWSTERSAEWHPVDPITVVEVAYDHFTGGRFRHGTKIVRWRPDKSPRQCTMDQVKEQGKSLALL
jgi:ATP-dependent DNA ligase